MASAIRIIAEEASFCDQEFEAMLDAVSRGVGITYTPLNGSPEPVSHANFWRGIDSAAEESERAVYRQRVIGDWEGYGFAIADDPRSRGMAQSREHRFETLRAEGKKLGEINAILEAEGYSEVFGEGVMPCPTKSHQIVRENKGARKMVETMGDQ